MARQWMEILPGKEAEWHIPAGMVARLGELIAEAAARQEKARSPEGSRVDAARAREGFRDLTAHMRDIHRRVFFMPPLSIADFISLGLRPHDLVRTNHFEVPETVEFVIHLHDIRQLIVEFWIEGAAHKAKPRGYQGAVIIWVIRDAPPSGPGDFTGHKMASRTPVTLSFDETERGKTVYVALAWQNDRGYLGEWSGFKSAVIP